MMVSITKYIQEDSKLKKSVIAYEHQVVAAGTILGVDHCLLGLSRVTNNTAPSRIQNNLPISGKNASCCSYAFEIPKFCSKLMSEHLVRYCLCLSSVAMLVAALLLWFFIPIHHVFSFKYLT